MENNLYYTPTLNEFYIGFECEILGIIGAKEDERLFSKPTIITQKELAIMHLLEIRVKILDQSDIESLGWKLGVLRLFNKDLTLFQLDKYPNYVLTTPIEAYEKTHIIDISRVKSIGEGLDRVFRGFIKNKSELKKLMQQLNIINYDNK